MKEEGEIAEDSLHSSKRLRLSILRSQNRGRPRNLSDSGGPSHSGASTSSSEPASLDDYFCRHALQNSSFVGTVDDSALGGEANFSGVTDTREQATGADRGLRDISYEVPDDVANQHGDFHGWQHEHVPSQGMQSNPAQLGIEVSPAMSVDAVVPPEAQVDPEEDTDDARQGGNVSGDDTGNHLEQEAEAGAFQEMESVVAPRGSQQQDERLPHNVATLDQSETLALGRTDILETSIETMVPNETESAIALADVRNQVIETVELSEDDVDAQSADPTLTASAFAEPRPTADDFDAFAPEPPHSSHSSQPVPKDSSADAGTFDSERLGAQLDSEGNTCSICMEPWTSAGKHRICSLACGHLFGKACIKRWLKLAGRRNGKCPHCNKRARAEDIRTLYVSRIAVIDGETQLYMQEADRLRTENEQLKKQAADLREEVRRTQTLFRALSGGQGHGSMFRSSIPSPRDQRRLHTSGSIRQHVAQRDLLSVPHGSILDDHFSRQSGRSNMERPQADDLSLERYTGEWTHRPDPPQYRSRGLQNFVLQGEKPLMGAKVFDMDSQSQSLIVSGRPPYCETSSGLTKIDISTLSEGECVNLPPGTNTIRDIRIAPFGTGAPGRLALVASLGKKLSLYSFERNIVVTAYTLPVGHHFESTFIEHYPSWACAWNPSDPNRIYTSLQNGTLLTFDLRRNSSPLDILRGPSSTPVHTLQYVPDTGRVIAHEDGTRESRGGGLLSASSNTLLFWPGIDQPQEKRPVYISQPGGPSVCVSVSYDATVEVMVASFRPKPTVLPSLDGASSSTPLTDSQADLPSQSSPTVPPESAVISVPIPTHFSYIRSSRPGTSTTPLSGTLNHTSVTTTTTSWEPYGRMVGHKSQAVLSRTAIVKEHTGWRSSPLAAADARRGCLFASGDEATRSVWLWDLNWITPEPKQVLRPHPSPVLDVRTTVVGGLDMLGCISERKVQLYKRSSYR